MKLDCVVYLSEKLGAESNGAGQGNRTLYLIVGNDSSYLERDLHLILTLFFLRYLSTAFTLIRNIVLLLLNHI